jgi:hypothetical protein
LRCRSTSSKPVKLPTDVPEGQQLDAERAAFEAAKRLFPKDLIAERGAVAALERRGGRLAARFR